MVLGCAFIYKGGFQRQGQKLGVGERGVGGGGVSHSSKWSFHQYSKGFTVLKTIQAQTSEQLINNADVLLKLYIYLFEHIYVTAVFIIITDFCF